MKIERINKGSWGKVRAFFDVKTQEGLVVKGFRIVEGINGLFVSFPSQKGHDDEYYDTVYADRELRDELTQLALKEFGGDIMSPDPENYNTPEIASATKETADITSPTPYGDGDDDIPF